MPIRVLISKRVLAPLFLISTFLLGFMAVRDPDFGWHYRCGNELITQGKACTSNNFSYFMPQYKAYNPSFIYDSLLAAFYNLGGFVAVGVFGGVVFAAIAAFFVAVFSKNASLLFVFAAYYIFFFLSGNIFNLGIRSQIMSIFFILVTIWAFEKKLLWLIPLTMFFWVNTHAGFFLGFIVAGVYWSASRQVKYGWVMLGMLAASCLNPFGPKVFLEVYRHFNSNLAHLIAEWLPPPVIVRSAVGLATLSLVTFSIKVKKTTPFLILLIFFAIASFMAKRNLPFFYFALFWSFFGVVSFPKFKWDKIASLVVVLAFMLVGVLNFKKAYAFNTSENSFCYGGVSDYPCRVIEKFNDPKANIFATYEWGGFLIWQWPKSKVFVDGRMPAWVDDYNSSPYQTWLYIIQTRPGWDKILMKYHTKYLLIGNGVFLDLLLQDKHGLYGWEELYRDSYTAFWRKVN